MPDTILVFFKILAKILYKKKFTFILDNLYGVDIFYTRYIRSKPSKIENQTFSSLRIFTSCQVNYQSITLKHLKT